MIERDNIEHSLETLDTKLSALEEVKKKIDTHTSELVSRGDWIDFDAIPTLLELESLSDSRIAMSRDIRYALAELKQSMLEYEATHKPSNHIEEMEYKSGIQLKFETITLAAAMHNIVV